MISETPSFRAATMLLDQGRFDLAEKELRLALAEDPNLAIAHAYLAICLSERESHTEATDEARHAVGLAPEESFMHYAHAYVLARRSMTREAIEAAWEAVGIDADEPRNWGILSSSLAMEKKYKEALAAADRGLELSPDDPVCVNVRAQALAGMGRSKEAAGTIEGALAKRPDDAFTHANMGWTLLGRGEARQALEHFRESLRLDPGSDWAREGLVEAMKARYLVYRLMLAYFLFMARLPGRVQWAIILGGLIGHNVLRSVARGNPAVAPYVWPVTIAYLTFVVLTWLSVPLANLALSLNRFGRASLRRHQVWWAWGLGAWIAVCLGLVGVWLATASDAALGFMAVASPLIVPIAMASVAQRGAAQWVMIGYLAVMGLLMLLLLPAAVLSTALMAALMRVYLFGCVLAPIALNVVNSMRPQVGR